MSIYAGEEEGHHIWQFPDNLPENQRISLLFKDGLKWITFNDQHNYKASLYFDNLFTESN